MKLINLKLISFLLVISFITPGIQSAELPRIKLRGSRHPEFVRIVLEGPEVLLSKGIVNQRGQDIVVNFQDSGFSLEDVELPFAYKTVRNTVVFSPKDFKQFKTVFLKSPPRLVIDVYQDIKIEEKKDGAKDKIIPLKTEIIIIDPGHGGYEYGLTAGNYREKDVVLDLAKTLRALIIKVEAQCLLTRNGDQFIPLTERAAFSNNKKGEIFLSLHTGRHKDIVLYTPVLSGSLPIDEGASAGQRPFISKTSALMESMQKAVRENLGANMVSVKPLPYSILPGIEAAALIIELPSLGDAGYETEFKKMLAATILKGIYFFEGSQAN
ncbi:MAG: N-acetylmuramoyl-L-alanine amidase [Nitrospirae bacterium]|nr:N-acetylmuramoyl-L-alanine amidase [Nitrospirota bacterium]MBI4838153.1 N-acetylmuramoyl-L-alanine amidase [Nitrospirota bacterium]